MNRLVRQPGWLSHSLAVFQAFSLTKLRFLMEVVRKLKFPNNSNKERIRSALFLSLTALICFAVFLYVLGHLRGFTDKTQFFLLNTIISAGLFMTLYSFLDFIFYMVFTKVNRSERVSSLSFIRALFANSRLKCRVFAKKIISLLFLGLFPLILAVLASVILVLSKGNVE
jgi:uncharacterized membrane protein YhdT